MTQQEILEYNERCLKILPFNYKNQSKYWVIYKYDDNSFFGKNRRYLAVNNLKFHSDWNWIKSVLEKISSLNEDDFSDETAQAFEDLLDLSLFSSKESVCESIYNFIKTLK